jgi:hypothetical protein
LPLIGKQPIEGLNHFLIVFSLFFRSSIAAIALSALFIPYEFKGRDRLPEKRGCCLDIFLSDRLLSIAIDVQADTLELYASDLDCASSATCLLTADTSKESWRSLLQIAIAHRQ